MPVILTLGVFGLKNTQSPHSDNYTLQAHGGLFHAQERTENKQTVCLYMKHRFLLYKHRFLLYVQCEHTLTHSQNKSHPEKWGDSPKMPTPQLKVKFIQSMLYLGFCALNNWITHILCKITLIYWHLISQIDEWHIHTKGPFQMVASANWCIFRLRPMAESLKGLDLLWIRPGCFRDASFKEPSGCTWCTWSAWWIAS